MLKWIIVGLIVIALISVVAITLYVQREAPYRSEVLVRGGQAKALILYHPSRDAGFSEELTEALARGFEDAGMTVERRTMAAATPASAKGFAVAAVVSNTFYARPDWPSMRYLKRADFSGVPTLGIMAGSGSTERAQATLTKALGETGADLRGVHSLWIARPNDPARPDENNRKVAASMARKFAIELGRQAMAQSRGPDPAAPGLVPPVGSDIRARQLLPTP